MSANIAVLQPLVVLVLWTFVMWLWMYVTRVPAVAVSGMKLDPNIPNGVQMSQLPSRVRWKADNYNHLLEQPTLFYALVLTLAVLDAGQGLNLNLAWTYVGLRIVHSLHQALWNKIEVRFSIFVLSSLVLLALAIRVALMVFPH